MTHVWSNILSTVVPSGIFNSRITNVKGTPNVPYKVVNWFSKASEHLVQYFYTFKAPGAAFILMVSIWSFCFLMIAARLPAFLSAERKLSWSSPTNVGALLTRSNSKSQLIVNFKRFWIVNGIEYLPAGHRILASRESSASEVIHQIAYIASSEVWKLFKGSEVLTYIGNIRRVCHSYPF